MKKMVAVLVAVAFLAVGCTGSFALTKKVYKFHREQDGKWMDELVFLGVVIIPIYGFATLGDAIIFNSIEFWTDKNPVEAKAWRQKTVVVADSDTKVIMQHSPEKNQIAMKVIREQENQQLVFSRSSDGVTVTDTQGNVLYVSKMDDKGGVTVFDAENNVTEHFSSKQVQLVHNNLN